MTIAPTKPGKERILLFGVGGTGKSEAILTTARKIAPATMFVIDTDYAWEDRLLPESEDIDNVEVFTLMHDDWEGLIAAIRDAKSQMQPGDWLAVDSVTPSWSAVQSWFVEKVYSKGIDDYFLEVRIAKEAASGGSDADRAKSLGALEGWMDWPVINKSYARLYNEILTCPGHCIMTAELARLSDEERADREVRGMYGPFNVKPVGQKRLGFIPHTVLLLSKSKAGYAMTTVKDRKREEMKDEPLTDFAVSYLMKQAGWRPVKAGAKGEG